MSVLSRRAGVASAIAATIVGAGALIPAAAGAAPTGSGRTQVPGTHPSWASGATAPATPATSGQVSLRVYLTDQNASQLAAETEAVSDPSSAQYGQYLSATQIQNRFAPSAAEASAVSNWLTGNGLTVTQTTSGVGAYVAATGTVAQAASAFQVSFAQYTDPSGATARAPQQTATVPAAISGDVLAVSGLDSASHQMKPADTLPPPDPNYWIAGPTSQFYGQKIAFNEPTANGRHWPWAVAGYTGQQLRGAYGVTRTGMTGRGQTVAIVDAYASPTMLSDADQFAQVTGNRPFAPGQYAQYLPPTYTETAADQCDAPGWYGEETLDVESVHDMAPDAAVHYVGAASCEDSDLLAADAKIVNNHLASIVSDSFGEPYDDATSQAVWDQVFEAGACEGIGFEFSSGDEGYEDPAVEDPGVSDQIQVDYPTSSPWVTSVGGTSLAVGPRDNYEGETSWGTLINPLAASGTSWSLPFPATYGTATTDWEYDGSSGGGVSTAYTQPWYQRGVVPTSLATAVPEGSTTTPMRVVPDVSALADPATGILVGETTLQPDGTTYAFSLSRIGGTSVASPVFAGIEADAQQAYGRDIGFANPAIYERYGSLAFHDVTDPPESNPQYIVRNNYTDPSTKTGPLLTYLRTLGVDGQGAAALPATRGYDDATGVGSPAFYVQSFARRRWH